MIDCQKIYPLAGLFAWSLLLPEIAAASELLPSAKVASPLPATSVLSQWVAEAVAEEGQAARAGSGEAALVGRAAPTPTMPEASDNEDASHALETAKSAVGAVKRDRNEGVDARVGVELAAAQASRPTAGVQGAQDDSLRLQSSTNSRDLQLVESVPAVADVIQVPLVQPADIAQTATTPSQSDQWHFLLVPYVHIPLSVSGSVAYEGEDNSLPGGGTAINGSRDFELSSERISTSLENDLNFALLSGFEAWTPDYHLGILANFDYLSLTSNQSLTRSVRFPGVANFVPTELDADLDTELWNAGLAASYRFYDAAKASPGGGNTEFDLGPFVADVLGGLNVTSLDTDLELSTNLGGEVEFSSSNTIVSPLLGGRLRWNANPQLAIVVSGNISGFGISGLTRYSVQGGVSWLFSGNTSLGLGYRFASLEYDTDEVEITADQNGPYLNFGLRF